MQETVLKAEPRTRFGTRAAHRLRKEGRLPAIICGLGQETLSVTLESKPFLKAIGEGQRFLNLQVGDKVERSLLKEVQYDALGSTIIHADFARVRRDQAVEVSVPVETTGIPKGVTGGGVLTFPVQELTLSGLPDDIPTKIRINIESIEIGGSIRFKDLPVPPRCKFLGDPETVVVSVAYKREEAVPAAPAEAEAVQPEVIGRKKEEEAAAAEGKEGKEAKEGKEGKEAKEGKEGKEGKKGGPG